MSSLAKRVGIRGPSLYKHFADREALLAAVEAGIFLELRERLRQIHERDNMVALRAMAHEFRKFAKQRPKAYALLYSIRSLEDSMAVDVRQRALEPAMDHLVPLYGTESLLRARVMVSFLHGFLSMETAGAFRLGESLDEAFEAGLKVILAR